MRIGFDAKRAYNNFTGLGNYSRYVLNGLVDYCTDDDLFAFTPKVNNTLKKQVARKLILQTPDSKLSKTFHFHWRSYKVTSLLEKRSIGIYHGLSNELPANIHKSPVKSVVTIHDLIFKRFPDMYKVIDRKIYDRKFKYACQASDRIVAVSEQTKRDIVEFYGIENDKIDVVYQDCSDIFHGSATNTLRDEVVKKYHLPAEYILCVGTIEERKNQLRLLEAYHKAGISVPLVLLGRGRDYLKKVSAYIQEQRLEKRVIILNNISSEDLPALYAQAMLFVYPSLFEGFGIPIIEAQNMGVPVLTSTGSCFAETGGKAARYIDPKNVDEMGEVIKELLQDEMGRIEMSRLGKENVMRFRAENTIPQLYDIYQGL